MYTHLYLGILHVYFLFYSHCELFYSTIVIVDLVAVSFTALAM